MIHFKTGMIIIEFQGGRIKLENACNFKAMTHIVIDIDDKKCHFFPLMQFIFVLFLLKKTVCEKMRIDFVIFVKCHLICVRANVIRTNCTKIIPVIFNKGEMWSSILKAMRVNEKQTIGANQMPSKHYSDLANIYSIWPYIMNSWSLHRKRLKMRIKLKSNGSWIIHLT